MPQVVQFVRVYEVLSSATNKTVCVHVRVFVCVHACVCAYVCMCVYLSKYEQHPPPPPFSLL